MKRASAFETTTRIMSKEMEMKEIDEIARKCFFSSIWFVNSMKNFSCSPVGSNSVKASEEKDENCAIFSSYRNWNNNIGEMSGSFTFLIASDLVFNWRIGLLILFAAILSLFSRESRNWSELRNPNNSSVIMSIVNRKCAQRQYESRYRRRVWRHDDVTTIESELRTCK